MIRILHIVPDLVSGGVAKFLLHYYERIDHSKFRFDFATHGGVVDFHKDLIKEGSVIYYIKPPHAMGGYIAYFRQIKDILHSNHYDIIHIHIGHATGAYALMCYIYGSRNIICHAHTTRCMNENHKIFMPLLRTLSRVFSKKLFACGIDAGNFCFGTNNFKVIPNGVDLNRFRAADPQNIDALRREIKIPEGSEIIGTVACFTHPKNHKYLIDIIEHLTNESDKYILLLVGDGELRPDIEKYAKQKGVFDKVRFVGNQENIPLYLSLMKCFLLPSFHEGLPVVSAEAQALGLKCIFSDRIDNSCDLGIGTMRFLSIDENAIDEWTSEIKKDYERPSEEKIQKLFSEKGYEIKKATKNLEREYQDIIK